MLALCLLMRQSRARGTAALGSAGLREAHNAHFVSRLVSRGPSFGIRTLDDLARARPDDPALTLSLIRARNNLGTTLLRAGRRDEALAALTAVPAGRRRRGGSCGDPVPSAPRLGGAARSIAVDLKTPRIRAGGHRARRWIAGPSNG